MGEECNISHISFFNDSLLSYDTEWGQLRFLISEYIWLKVNLEKTFLFNAYGVDFLIFFFYRKEIMSYLY